MPYCGRVFDHSSLLTSYEIVHEVHLQDDLTVRGKTVKPKRRETEIVCQLSGRQLSSFRNSAPFSRKKVSGASFHDISVLCPQRSWRSLIRFGSGIPEETVEKY